MREKQRSRQRYLPKYANCREFLNADLIAAGLSPFNTSDVPFQASEITLAHMNLFIEQRKTFAFETTLSARSYASKIPQWKALGYCVSMFFLWLPTVDFAIQRVNNRVRQGGHDIPVGTIRRRYQRGLLSFVATYATIVDRWQLFDGADPVRHQIAASEGDILVVDDEIQWQAVQASIQVLTTDEN